MKIHNIIRFDSDGNNGEIAKVILTFADRDKAEERVQHLYRQNNPKEFSRGVDCDGNAVSYCRNNYPTFAVVSKTLLGFNGIKKKILRGKI